MSPCKPAQPAYRDRDCMGTDRVSVLRRRSPDHFLQCGLARSRIHVRRLGRPVYGSHLSPPSAQGYRSRQKSSTGHPNARYLPLPRVRPDFGTNGAALRANHPRPERWHAHLPRPLIRVGDRLGVAGEARHGKRPHAVGPHVAQRHRFDGFVEARHAKEKPRGEGPKDQVKASSMYIAGRPSPTPADYPPPAAVRRPRPGRSSSHWLG
jgi:hypothetical protein